MLRAGGDSSRRQHRRIAAACAWFIFIKMLLPGKAVQLAAVEFTSTVSKKLV